LGSKVVTEPPPLLRLQPGTPPTQLGFRPKEGRKLLGGPALLKTQGWRDREARERTSAPEERTALLGLVGGGRRMQQEPEEPQGPLVTTSCTRKPPAAGLHYLSVSLSPSPPEKGWENGGSEGVEGQGLSLPPWPWHHWLPISVWGCPCCHC
jgi:hypothetical protein